MNLAVLVGLLAICYGLVLFSISVYADKFLDKISSKAMVVLLSLSLAVYCSAWSFLGSISQAATDLWSFVPIFLAPILIFTAGFPIIKKMAIVSKAQNITSMADFIAARYGKSKSLAAFVSIFSFIGILPYITLQLKALISSLYLFQPNSNQIDISFYAILTLISFTILFGTRKLDATEHNKGMILAIACESVFKLAIFIGVSCYIVYFIFNGANDIWVQAQHKNIIIGEVLKLEKLFPALFLCAAAFFVCLDYFIFS